MSIRVSFVIAARRTAIGRIGGLHKSRRIDELAAPIIDVVLTDARLTREQVDEIIIGNTTGAGDNPARLIALAAGLSEQTTAHTIDRQCASGLEAVMSGVRLVATGGANIVIAGGVESPSTAPWRIVKPKTVYQMPRFQNSALLGYGDSDDTNGADAAEQTAKKFGISRERQDLYALKSHLKAAAAQDAGGLTAEMVPFRVEAIEARDESLRPEMTGEILAQMPAYFPPDGTVTSGNRASINDGAALSVIVSEEIYASLGRPPALRVVAGTTAGVRASEQGISPAAAIHKLFQQSENVKFNDVKLIEFGEPFASQVLASLDALKIDSDRVNKDGGAIALGNPLGANSAVLVTRIFSQMVRQREETSSPPEFGLAALGATGGLGAATLFQAT